MIYGLVFVFGFISERGVNFDVLVFLSLYGGCEWEVNEIYTLVI